MEPESDGGALFTLYVVDISADEIIFFTVNWYTS